jgi:hypothetical protein
MSAIQLQRGWREKAARLARRLRLDNEEGQGTTEYALVSAGIIVGGGASLLLFAPRAIEAFDAYVHGFYLLLGLPVP